MLTVHGGPVHTFEPRHAQRLGISIIPQELLPIPDMKVWQNLLVGRERTFALGFIRRREMVEEARRLLSAFGLKVDPEAPMRRLGVATTQMIEIIKATSRDSTVVLMDEPSSSLSSNETEQLFRVIRLLRSRGTCILYTSHRMEEIEQISDTVAIIRDGAIIRHAATSAMTERQIITDMVGRDIEDMFPNRTASANERKAVLEVRDLLEFHGLRGRNPRARRLGRSRPQRTAGGDLRVAQGGRHGHARRATFDPVRTRYLHPARHRLRARRSQAGRCPDVALNPRQRHAAASFRVQR